MSSNGLYQGTINIDFDVFKALTAERTSESDTFNDVLRRKYGLPPRQTLAASLVAPARHRGSWTCDGVEFPDGTQFRVFYKKDEHTAQVSNGALVYGGQRYSSPSAAAIAVTGGNVNGWRFWECQFPGETRWTKIDRLRIRDQSV